VWAVPSGVVRAAGAVVGRFNPVVKDMATMFGWFDTGRCVADPRRQEQLFGPVPTAEDALAALRPARTCDAQVVGPNPTGGSVANPGSDL